MTRTILQFAAVSLLLSAAAPALDAPPSTPVGSVVDHLFGLALPDPYRWMEGADNPKFNAWLKLQGEYTRTRLDALPTLGSWRTRLHDASAKITINRLQRRAAGRLFFLRVQAGRPGVLMVRDVGGTERVILDPNPSATSSGTASVTEYSPSPDGKFVAVNVDRGGNEVTQVSLIDVDSGVARRESLEAIWGEFPVIWLPDGSGFTYTQMAPKEEIAASDPMTNMRVRIHYLGKDVAGDPMLLRAGTNPRVPLRPDEFPTIDASADSEYAVASAGGARPETRICVAPKARVLQAGAPWSCVVDYSDEVHGFELHGSVLYLLSMKGAPNGRILALDLKQTPLTLARAHVLVPESRETVLTGTACARDALYVRQMRVGIDSFLRIPHGGSAAQALVMPFAGAAYVMSTRPNEDGLIFTLQSWTQPRSAFAYEPSTNQTQDLRLGASTPGDYSGIVANETEAVSRDGTHVPLTIISRQDAARDGNNLAILDGYGGYGVSAQPYFDPMVLEWVKAGHIYAVAHVRGGGEKGNDWWLGGKPPKKANGVDDFIACAERLAAMQLTSPGRTAASGASAGGLLIGGAITLAPARFGAANIHAGMLNPVRLLAGANGANQIAEVGDPRTANGLSAIAAMDPYQRIRDGVHYPPLILDVGLNDSRVVPWESGKFGARLQAASPNTNSVWFRTNGDAGHLMDSEDQAAAELADQYAFFEQVLH
jgi:prolyl oligopeptidase